MVNFLRYVLILLVVSFSLTVQQASAQSASFSSDFLIKLEGETVHPQYVLDISHFNFKNREVCKNFFQAMNSNTLFFELGEKTDKVTMHVFNDRFSTPQSVAQWNSFFTNSQERYRLLFSKIQ